MRSRAAPVGTAGNRRSHCLARSLGPRARPARLSVGVVANAVDLRRIAGADHPRLLTQSHLGDDDSDILGPRICPRPLRARAARHRRQCPRVAQPGDHGAPVPLRWSAHARGAVTFSMATTCASAMREQGFAEAFASPLRPATSAPVLRGRGPLAGRRCGRSADITPSRGCCAAFPDDGMRAVGRWRSSACLRACRRVSVVAWPARARGRLLTRCRGCGSGDRDRVATHLDC